MGEELKLDEIREKCGIWDDELETCMDDFPSECPFQAECQKEAESEE